MSSLNMVAPTATITPLPAAREELLPPVGLRAQRLKTALHEAGYSLCLERPRLLRKFYRSGQGKGEHPQVRRAMALAYVMSQRQPRIYDDELVIGNVSSKRVAANYYPEGASINIVEDIWRLENRTVPLKLSLREKGELLSLAADNVLTNMAVRAFLRPGGLRQMQELLQPQRYVVTEEAGIAHHIGDFHGVVTTGLCVADRVAAHVLESGRLPEGGVADADQLAFYKALRITIGGIRRMAENLAAAAEQAALRSDLSAGRRGELLAAAQACRRVPYYPAATFQEGVQACWLMHLAMLMEDYESGLSFGRLDQALIHRYEADLARGALTHEQAMELMVSFQAKCCEPLPLYSERMDRYFGGNATIQGITVGGVDADGNDAGNAVSELILEAYAQLGTREPNLQVRVHAGTSPRLMDKALALMQRTGARPTLIGDEAMIAGLLATGMPLAHARDYGVIGCVEPASQGRTNNSADAALSNLLLCLELALNGGRNFAGKRLGVATPPVQALSDFAAVLAAYRRQVDHMVGDMHAALCQLERTYRVHRTTPVMSLMTQGCLTAGRDVTCGGALYDYTGVQAVGLADTGDSLYALNRLVFEERRCTLAELVAILKADFAGHEPLRVELSRRFARYGNGDAAADRMAQLAANAFTDAVHIRRNTRGGQWLAGFYSMTCGTGFGRYTGASASGRKAGQRLANGASPSDGSDRKGPTAALRSVSGLDRSGWGNSYVFNLKFDSKLVAGAVGRRHLGGLFRDYLVNRKGTQVQANVLGVDTLLAARLNPEDYPDLLVRLSGYCAYFNDLSPEMKDEVIARMSHGL